jgi:hypothetical protein
MSPDDRDLFFRSLEANSASELAKAALLWEDYFLPRYPSAFFLIRVGDVHSTLGSPTTALPLYLEVSLGLGLAHAFLCFASGMLGRPLLSLVGHSEALCYWPAELLESASFCRFGSRVDPFEQRAVSLSIRSKDATAQLLGGDVYARSRETRTQCLAVWPGVHSSKPA